MIKRIVLTGGPCAGKTTILSRIEQDLETRGYKVFIVNESATELINGGITPHKDCLGMFDFQRVNLYYQYYKEEIYNKAIYSDKFKDVVIVYDRGLLDNKAYISDLEFNQLLKELSLDAGKEIKEDSIVSRYDMVIHLRTSAGNKGYSLESNGARYESESEAILLDERTRSAWEIYNNLHVVDSVDNFEEKVVEVLSLIHNCLEI